MNNEIKPGDPKQLRILKKLCAHVEATPGYDGIECVRGKLVVTASELVDKLSIIEAPRPIDGTPAGNMNRVRNESWQLYLQGWPKDDKVNPSDPAYYMKAAVEVQLSRLIDEDDETGLPKYPTEYLLGREITSLTVGQGVVRPPSDEAASRLAMFYIPLTIGLVTDIRNPYKKG